MGEHRTDDPFDHALETMSSQMNFSMQSQACACPPKMTAVRSAWSLSSSTGSAAASTHRGTRLPEVASDAGT
jgi:hypothetical protein